MTQLKRNNCLRQWFGPMAQQLFNIISSHRNSSTTCDHHRCILLDKQAAQHFLIEASFYQQKCIQQFQVTSDIRAKCLNPIQAMSELLLYIRMTNQHPSHENLHIFSHCHLPYDLEFEAALEALVVAKLIQKIEFLHFTFYDKNPYPHDHIFDHKSFTLTDQNRIERLFDHQRLIPHQTTN